MKKNILFIALGLLIGSVTLTGCKKGENDPFLSLKSRDARITASWQLVKVEATTLSNSWGTPSTSTQSFNGTTMSSTNNGIAGTSYSYSWSVEILKDGTFTSVEVINGSSETINGRWYWLNAAKNKTNIVLGDFGIFEVNGLKSKELTLKNYSKDVFVSGGSTTTDESTSILTFEKN